MVSKVSPASGCALPAFTIALCQHGMTSLRLQKYQPTAEGQARMGLAKNRKALLNVASSSQSMTAATLLTAQMPMFGLFAMSLLVNLVLVAAIRARRAKRNSRSVLSSNAVKV